MAVNSVGGSVSLATASSGIHRSFQIIAAVNFLVHAYTTLESQANTDWEHLEAFSSAAETLTHRR
jgi:hypothetical protein